MCAITFDWVENDAKEKFRHFRRSKSPSWGVIELTSLCNFNCKWCFANSGIRGTHMPLSDVKRVITAFKDSGLKQITFSGGEPTLYPHLREVVALAKAEGFIVHMNTNGFLFDQKLCTDLAELGLTQVQINIDSINPYKHDLVRGKEGSFNKAVMALKHAQDAKITTVSQTVVTRLNEGELYEIIDLARRIGVHRSRVWDMTPSEGVARKNIIRHDLRPTDFIGAVRGLAQYATSRGAVSIESSDPLFPLEYKPGVPVTGGYCVFAAGLVINSSFNGDVFFCCTDREPLYNIFDVLDRGLKLTQTHMQALKRKLGTFEVPVECSGCCHFGSCRGGCFTRRAFSKQNIDYFCARLTEMYTEAKLHSQPNDGRRIQGVCNLS